MKVLMINGSPNDKGCTYTALNVVSEALAQENIDSEIVWVGRNCIKGCIGCGACSESHRCVFDGGVVNEILDKMEDADALVVGTPGYFASPTGSLVSVLDRIFMAGKQFAMKPAAAVAIARRAGMTPSIDVIQRYFNLAGMPIVSANYYNMVFGPTSEEVLKDEEGVQTLRILGKNMAWLLRCIEAGKAAGIVQPSPEKKIKMTFIK